jgi:uncharacterized repeat protein (TIGR03806 family)
MWLPVRPLGFVVIGAGLSMALHGCDACNSPPDPTPGADAGPADPNTVGLNERPSNATCTAPNRPAVSGDIATTRPWPNIDLNSPLLMLPEPGTDALYVIERGGRIVRFNKNDGAVVDPEEFGDISDRVLTTDEGGDERGLLGMAFHPDWPTVEEIYLAYTGFGVGGEPLSDVVARFGIDSDGLLNESSEQRLIEIPDFAGNHNGGMIAFSPTDPCTSCLYYGTGDGGAGDDPDENGQDPSSLLSKILRIDVDADDAGAYGIPADNPFIDEPGFAPEVFAWGFRNPWRWSFDRDSGDLWVGDVGQGAVEEIDLVAAGGNYGWDVFEGNECHADSAGDDCDAGGFEEPVVAYAQTQLRRSVTGGYVSRGPTLSTFAGTYFYADFVSGEVFALFYDDNGAAAPEVVLNLPFTIASFSEDRDGELYIINHEAGVIEQLVLAGPPVADTFPQHLSDTGCADVSGLVPYGPAHSLYSDNAQKERFLALPADGRATILEDGDIDFPVGTVFRKDFAVAGARIETRLFVRHRDGDWAGYTYEWNGDGSDADLVAAAGKTKELPNGQTWSYPARNGCLACHAQAARRVLGLEIAQLNVGFVYASTGRLANQLTTWEAIGLFDAPLPAPPVQLPSLPPADDANAAVEDVARAYLHVNCATCHRPGGIGIAETDWRFDTSFATMGLCNAVPTEGDLGVAGALRLVPGNPDLSLVSLRMKRLGAGRMPLLGSLVVDELGTDVIDRWIASLEGCP